MSTRRRSRCWSFTWNNPFEGWRAQITELFTDLEVEYIMQLEKVSTVHVQGAIYFRNPREMNFQEEFPREIHWERGKNWRNLKKYCCKRESRIDGPWSNVVGLTWRRSIRDPMEGLELKDWQEEILETIKKNPDDRTIYWFYDRRGGVGKSTFCKHLVLKHGAILVGGRKRDAEFAVSRVDEEKDVELIVMDIPRSQENIVSYSAIEEIKNGMFFSSKYESGMCIFNIPHLIVFSNFPPRYDQMSEDRWHVRELMG